MRNRIMLALGACTLMTLNVQAFGQNRQTSDAIFTEPRGSAIAQVMYTLGDAIIFKLINPKLPQAAAITEADANLLAAIKSSSPDAIKLEEVRKAETNLAAARLQGLRSMDFMPRLIRSARVVGSTLILVDVVGRVWVWGALNANPTWSPAVTALRHVADQMSTDHALSR